MGQFALLVVVAQYWAEQSPAQCREKIRSFSNLVLVALLCSVQPASLRHLARCQEREERESSPLSLQSPSENMNNIETKNSLVPTSLVLDILNIIYLPAPVCEGRFNQMMIFGTDKTERFKVPYSMKSLKEFKRI